MRGRSSFIAVLGAVVVCTVLCASLFSSRLTRRSASAWKPQNQPVIKPTQPVIKQTEPAMEHNFPQPTSSPTSSWTTTIRAKVHPWVDALPTAPNPFASVPTVPGGGPLSSRNARLQGDEFKHSRGGSGGVPRVAPLEDMTHFIEEVTQEEVTHLTGQMAHPTGEITHPTGEITRPIGQITDPRGEMTRPLPAEPIRLLPAHDSSESGIRTGEIEAWDGSGLGSEGAGVLRSLLFAVDRNSPPHALDFSCPRESSGRDRCACQIPCQNMACSNARAVCQRLGKCERVRSNKNRRPIATLKSSSYALAAIYPDWPEARWEDKFGAGGEQAVYVIGEQKCGTTQLYDLIQRHPKVHKQERKEHHLFDHYHHLDTCRLETILRRFRPCKPGTIQMDATPDYLQDPVAAALISSVSPRAKIVALVRDPAKRAHAAWDHNRRAGSESRTFVEAVNHELPAAMMCRNLVLQLTNTTWSPDYAYRSLLRRYVERCVHYEDGSPNNCWVNHQYSEVPSCKRYLVKGFYGPHIRLWLRFFPAENMLGVDSEALFADPEEVKTRVLAFLGLSHSPTARRSLLTSVPVGGANCWHECGKEKTVYTKVVDPATEAALRRLYVGTDSVLEGVRREVQWVRAYGW